MSNWGNEEVVVSLAMLKVGDKVAELVELSEQLNKQLNELVETLSDWADALDLPTQEEE